MAACAGCHQSTGVTVRCNRIFPDGDPVNLCGQCVERLGRLATDRAHDDGDHHRVVGLAVRLAGETWRFDEHTYWFERPLTHYFGRLQASSP